MNFLSYPQYSLQFFFLTRWKENNWCLLLPLVMDGIMIRHCSCLSNFSLGSSSHLSTSWAQIPHFGLPGTPVGFLQVYPVWIYMLTSLLKTFFPPGFSGHQPPSRCAPVCHVLRLLHHQVAIASLFNVAWICFSSSSLSPSADLGSYHVSIMDVESDNVWD